MKPLNLRADATAVARILLTNLIALVGLCAATGSPASECVQPSPDVVTGTVLRAQPTTSSARLGTLAPGQSLRYAGSQASWYGVGLADGTAAYVSKRWTTLVPCPPESPTVPSTATAAGPSPLLSKDHPVDWWFVFKFNAVKFPGCGMNQARPLTCPFGGTLQIYGGGDGQQFVFASSDNTQLKQGTGCTGTTEQDPVGATYDEIYNGRFHYVVWNDQFKGDPHVPGCSGDCGAGWGHSKGMLAWDDAGNAIVMQVTTPSWPGAGNQERPRQSDGNTLGCVKDDNVKFSQHFFSLKLTKGDLILSLRALQNASVATDLTNLQIVNNGGPSDVQALLGQLGRKSASTRPTLDTLSSGVRLISKPAALHVPPWHLVSALLGSIPLRTATWWTNPDKIEDSTAATPIDCWDDSLPKPGSVSSSATGVWNGTTFGLVGTAANGNHAKFAISTDPHRPLTIFGDMNQEGTLTGTTTPTGTCKASQNGRGGLFFVVQDSSLTQSVAALINGGDTP
jgi:hypothetical protein